MLLILAAVTGATPAARADFCEPAQKNQDGSCPDLKAAKAPKPPAKKMPPLNPVFDMDCGAEVQLDKPGSGLSMEQLPVQDQDGVGICYAEAGVGLIDAYRATHGDKDFPKHLTSPFAAAISASITDQITEKDKSKMTIEGGSSCSVVGDVEFGGLSCDASSIEQGVFAPAADPTPSAAYLKQFRKFYDDYWAGIEAKVELKNQKSVLRAVLRENFRDTVHACMVKLGFPVDSIPDDKSLEKYLDESNPLKYLQGVFAQACSGKTADGDARSIKLKSLFGTSCDRFPANGDGKTSDPTAFRDLLNKRLESPNPQPVEIDICAPVLTQTRGTPMVDRKEGKLIGACVDAKTGDAKAHAVLVIGKRRDPVTQKCQYRVRNSWGTGCGYYPSDWDCDKGNIWVDADVLTQNTFGASMIDP